MQSSPGARTPLTEADRGLLRFHVAPSGALFSSSLPKLPSLVAMPSVVNGIGYLLRSSPADQESEAEGYIQSVELTTPATTEAFGAVVASADDRDVRLQELRFRTHTNHFIRCCLPICERCLLTGNCKDHVRRWRGRRSAMGARSRKERCAVCSRGFPSQVQLWEPR